jgi:hypothetical protein
MSESSSSGTPPSAEDIKERMEELGTQADLGAGDEEPDPATAESPPGEGGAGAEKRPQT